MDLERRQRNDIDAVTGNRLTLDIDELTLVESPYAIVPERFEGNNWIIVDNKYTKYSIAEDDSLAFIFDPIRELSQKDISDVVVSFDFNATGILLDNISLSHDDMSEQKMCKIPINGDGHIDVSCGIFGLNNEVLNAIISGKGFNLGLNLKGLKSNTTVKIWNVNISFKFTNKLCDESGAVVNRLEPYVDFYKEGNELILQIGDGSGKGHKEDQGGNTDTYSKEEINRLLSYKVDTESGKGLSSNDYSLLEKNKLAGIEEGANKYTHPANHYTNMIKEGDGLQNLEISANADQHTINLAVDSAFGGVGTALDDKQDLLISGSNIKTINDESILGSGNIVVQGGSSVDIVTSWESTPSDSKVASEKLCKDSLDAKANSTHSHTTSDISNFPTLSTVATTGSYSDLSNKPSIPSKVSDLTNDSDFIEKSNTQGLVKNDGSIDTTSYSTFTGSYNDLSNKPSIPSSSSDLSDGSNIVKKSNTVGLIKNDGSIDTTTYLSSLPSHNHDDRYYTESEMDTALNGKQATLQSGVNIKTINSESILGSGNLVIQGGGGSGGSYINDFYGDSSTNELVIDYDTGVSQADIVTSWSSTTSDTNVPSEKLTKNSLDGKANSTHNHNYSDLNSVSTVTITVTYSNNTSENITLLKYTGS